MKRRNIYILIVLSFLLCNCDKNKGFLNNDGQINTVVPEINLLSPTNDVLTANTQLKISANFSANTALHMYGFWLRNKKTGFEYASDMTHYHGTAVSIDTTLAATWKQGDTLALQVYTINHSSQTNTINRIIIVK